MRYYLPLFLCFLLTACGEDRDALFAKAKELHQEGDFTAEREIFAQILNDQPEDLQAIEGMIAVTKVQNATQEHAHWNRELLKFRPWHREANIVVGKQLMEEGNLPDAVSRFVLALNSSEFKLEKQEVMILLEQARQKQETLKEVPQE